MWICKILRYLSNLNFVNIYQLLVLIKVIPCSKNFVFGACHCHCTNIIIFIHDCRVSLRMVCFCSIFGRLVRLVCRRLQDCLNTFGVYQWIRYFWYQKSFVAFRCKIKKKTKRPDEWSKIYNKVLQFQDSAELYIIGHSGQLV